LKGLSAGLLGEHARREVEVAGEDLGVVGVEAKRHHHGHGGCGKLGVGQHLVVLVLLLCLLGGVGGSAPLQLLRGLLIVHLARPYSSI
jgi:hypothetical protein